MSYTLPAPLPQWAVPGKMPEELFFVTGEQPRPKHMNAWRHATSALQTTMNEHMRFSALGKRFNWRDITTMVDTGTGLTPEIVAVPTVEDEVGVELKGQVVGQEAQVEEFFISGPIALEDGLVEIFFRTLATTGAVEFGAEITPLIEGTLEGTPVTETATVNVSATEYGFDKAEIFFENAFPSKGLWAKVRIFRNRWSANDTVAAVPQPVYVVAGSVL